MNNTSCNQPKVVQEPEIQAPRGNELQNGVGTLELWAVWMCYVKVKYFVRVTYFGCELPPTPQKNKKINKQINK